MLAASLERAYELDWYNKLWAKWFGLGFIVFVWIVYMASLYFWLGYEHNVARRLTVLLLFCMCVAAFSTVLWGVGMPFTYPYTSMS